MNNRKTGFTLIELMVVVLIIMLLASVVIVSLSVSRRSSRDAKRISDINIVSSALQLYYADNHSYPNPFAWNATSFNSIAGSSSATLLNPTHYLDAPISINPYPDSNYATNAYFYQSVDGSVYELGFIPEDSKNYTYSNLYLIINGQVSSIWR